MFIDDTNLFYVFFFNTEKSLIKFYCFVMYIPYMIIVINKYFKTLDICLKNLKVLLTGKINGELSEN